MSRVSVMAMVKSIGAQTDLCSQSGPAAPWLGHLIKLLNLSEL